MYKVLAQEELLPFWHYANRYPDVRSSLHNCRIEHNILGRGTITEIVPKPVDRDGPKVYMRVCFDESLGARNGNGARSRVLLLPFVLNKRLLKRLAIPRGVADAFRLPMPQRKAEWRRFEELVKKHNIRTLFHFTDVRNLNSIRCHGGLYSWRQCEIRGIEIAAPGGDFLSRQLDRQKELEDYVRLSFNNSQPMMHVASRDRRISGIKVLEILPSVIYLGPTLLSNINATIGTRRWAEHRKLQANRVWHCNWEVLARSGAEGTVSSRGLGKEPHTH